MKRAKTVVMTEQMPDMEALQEAGKTLRNGGLVAFPTETVYGLGGNALDPEASRKIYAAKGRPSDNPLIIHIARLADLEKIAGRIPDQARKLAEAYWPGPLTMIFEKTELVPFETTGGLTSVAVRFPSNRIAQELILCAGGFVAAPSANTSGRPSPTLARHVEEDLGDQVDWIIDGGAADIGLESTIVDFTSEIPTILRPGYLNQEMLEAVIGPVLTDPGLTRQDVRPKAPGMKYKHYAPKADLKIVEGTREAVSFAIRVLVQDKLSDGKKVGIICTEETSALYPEGVVEVVGNRADESSIARHLYDTLRRMDEKGVAYIYSESFYTPMIGQAIMNRLMKAAGHKVLQVS